MKNRKERLKDKDGQRRNEKAVRKLRALQEQIDALVARVNVLEGN
jgi:hypothetical protein